jgi:hypothetical protein
MHDIIVFCNGLLLILNSYRCCVKGSLLEINERLIKQPDLLNIAVSTSCYLVEYLFDSVHFFVHFPFSLLVILGIEF